MAISSQWCVPVSFLDVYRLHPNSPKCSVDRATLEQRYEWCEDMAQALTEQAGHWQWRLGIHETDVLQRVHASLQAPEVGVSPAEAVWVVWRLAELLGWLPACAGLKLDAAPS